MYAGGRLPLPVLHRRVGPTAGSEAVDALEFLARLTSHIPNKGRRTPWGGCWKRTPLIHTRLPSRLQGENLTPD